MYDAGNITSIAVSVNKIATRCIKSKFDVKKIISPALNATAIVMPQEKITFSRLQTFCLPARTICRSIVFKIARGAKFKNKFCTEVIIGVKIRSVKDSSDQSRLAMTSEDFLCSIDRTPALSENIDRFWIRLGVFHFLDEYH